MSSETDIKRIQSVKDLENLRSEINKRDAVQVPVISICGGTGCRAAGSEELRDSFIDEIEKRGLREKVQLKETGCHGFCERGPIVVIRPKKIFYQRVTPEDVPEIISETIINGNIIERLLYADPITNEKIIYETDVPFYKHQTRIVLGASGYINPTEIEDYIAIGGYRALGKTLFEIFPDETINEIKESGLCGRGGAGFSTGGKWELCRKARGDIKYVICNEE